MMPAKSPSLSGSASAATGCPILESSQAVTICYEYDPLQRLVEANYSNGDYYHYEYDQVGNRTKQTSSLSGQVLVTDYVYDAANRLSSVNGVQYVYDNNGNLLSNGVTTTFTMEMINIHPYRLTSPQESNPGCLQ